jgi:hypothetical protein
MPTKYLDDIYGHSMIDWKNSSLRLCLYAFIILYERKEAKAQRKKDY